VSPVFLELIGGLKPTLPKLSYMYSGWLVAASSLKDGDGQLSTFEY